MYRGAAGVQGAAAAAGEEATREVTGAGANPHWPEVAISALPGQSAGAEVAGVGVGV